MPEVWGGQGFFEEFLSIAIVALPVYPDGALNTRLARPSESF
jgi:hypothetical protein